MHGSRLYLESDLIRTNFFRGSIDFNRITNLMYGARVKAGISTPFTRSSSFDFDISYQVEEIFGRSTGASLAYSYHVNKFINFFTDAGYRLYSTSSHKIKTSETNINIGFGVSF